MSTLDDWTQALCAELGLAPEDREIEKAVLDLARVVAHKVDRPAAPLTAYLVGVAVGRGESVAEARAKAEQLADRWPSAPA
jgi:hypothetical protein